MPHELDPVAYFLSAAVNYDGLEAYKLKESNILYHIVLQFFVKHGRPAVLYNYYPPVEALYVRKRLNQNSRLLLKVKYLFVFQNTAPFLRTIISVYLYVVVCKVTSKGSCPFIPILHIANYYHMLSG